MRGIKNKIFITSGCLLLTAIWWVGRFAGIHQPYHQDEYKWALIVDPVHGLTGTVPHPPLPEFLYHGVGTLLSYDWLRLVPLLFSFLTVVWVSWYLWRRFSGAAAAWGGLFLTLNLYNVIASLQVDIDGALLPFWVALLLGSYDLWRHAVWRSGRRRWLLLMALATLGGLFTKLSFVLAPATIILLELWQARRGLRRFPWGEWLKKYWWGGVAAGVVLFYVLFSRQGYVLNYVQNFLAWSARDWSQLFILSVKAWWLFSPLGLIALFLGAAHYRVTKVWWWFLGVNAAFYLVLFDFTHRTLDRYWMFLILPAAILLGVGGERLKTTWTRRQWLGVVAVLVGVTGLTIVWWTQEKITLPLVPKTTLLTELRQGNFNLLLPLSGGSGPAGFYLPVDFILLAWLLVGLLLFVFWRRRQPLFLVGALFIGLLYNGLGSSEYLWGKFYGSVPQVLRTTTAAVMADKNITTVITYNDNGAYELIKAKKYFKRFYPHPLFAAVNAEKFRTYTGWFMVVDFPRLATDSVYAQYFSTCELVFQTQDKKISGRLYDCRAALPDKFFPLPLTKE